jgi:ribA/ribD-fused uncharacterized protein
MISSFSGEHRFLSNFWQCKVLLGGLQFESTEAAFQAAKCADPGQMLQFQCLSPAEAKRTGRQIQIRPDWNDIRERVMWFLLMQKFAPGTELAQRLLATGDQQLIEGNQWHDNYWGSCTCFRCSNFFPGLNRLGHLLMQVRAELQ